MKIKFLAMASVLALSVSGLAQAEPVAGWDFSQFQGPGSLSTDGSTFSDTLPANYSSVDPNNLGPSSGQFGTMYADGSNGSTAVAASSTTTTLRSKAGSLRSNITGSAADAGDKSFDALTTLTLKGQDYANRLSLSAGAVVDVVFGADLSGVGGGSGYAVSFGGGLLTLAGSTSASGGTRLEAGCGGSASVDVDFSTDGSSYSYVGTADITGTDQEFLFLAPGGSSNKGFFRLALDPTGGCTPVIDNVAIDATRGGHAPSPITFDPYVPGWQEGTTPHPWLGPWSQILGPLNSTMAAASTAAPAAPAPAMAAATVTPIAPAAPVAPVTLAKASSVTDSAVPAQYEVNIEKGFVLKEIRVRDSGGQGDSRPIGVFESSSEAAEFVVRERADSRGRLRIRGDVASGLEVYADDPAVTCMTSALGSFLCIGQDLEALAQVTIRKR